MTEAIVRDTTFVTVGTQRRLTSGVEGMPWGTGTEISYIVSSDTIRVELGDGRTFDFANPGAKFHPFADFNFVNGTDSEGRTPSLYLLSILVDGVPLTYTRFASFGLGGAFEAGSEIITGSQFLFGSPTTNMPKSGSANYTVVPGGAVTVGGTQGYTLSTNSSATLTANFLAGTVSTSLHLVGAPTGGGSERDFGSMAGSGATSQAAFQGTWSNANGGFWGSFFGPAAQEVGYAFAVAKDDFTASGVVVGRKD